MLKDYHQVTEIIPGKVVTVRTNKGSFEAGKVIITAGPWGPAMVKKLGIELPFKVSETSNKVYSVCEANATLGTEPLIDDVRNHRCSDERHITSDKSVVFKRLYPTLMKV